MEKVSLQKCILTPQKQELWPVEDKAVLARDSLLNEILFKILQKIALISHILTSRNNIHTKISAI